MRNWLLKHNKGEMIDFTTEDRKQYKEVFDALDNDGSKAITIKELEEPLIALGFVASREKVEELVAEVDEDGSGKIEFDEFLLIMRSIKKGKGQSSLFDFFDDMIKGKLSRMGDMDPEQPFMLNISMYRRRRIMDAIMSRDEEKKKSGQKIMNVSLLHQEFHETTYPKQARRKSRERRGPYECCHRRYLCFGLNKPENRISSIYSTQGCFKEKN